ncbi:mevalonate kinase [Corynebacterium sp. TAE3-ERU12]|uniref:mevalonate kinase n=1 Tax=Corynebacterium sp. TAE3-ERU12 TaxID=2849491 RepID=UPI001C48A74D|nr:mevalonate kinase [Corynebacterium sp. TAE3-ERU12]
MTTVEPPVHGDTADDCTTDCSHAVGEAHAKAILIGEHSVVYGHPAIAVPVTSLRTVAYADAEEGPIRFGIDGSIIDIDELPSRIAPIGEAARLALRACRLPESDVLIRIRTGIPTSAGLGGSAAVAHAVVEAVRSFAGVELTEQERFELVQGAERIAHGNPSGLDATATRSLTPVHFQQGTTRPLQLGARMWVVLGDTGVRGSTSDAVARVRGFVDSRGARGTELMDTLGALTAQAEQLLADGDIAALGAVLDKAQTILDELGVGHEAVTDLVAAARAAGAVGAKLTGAGCGGCVLALADSVEQAREIRSAMTDANAVACWIMEVAPTSEDNV